LYLPGQVIYLVFDQQDLESLTIKTCIAIAASGTGWPDEFVKREPKMEPKNGAQLKLMSNFMRNLSRGKK
jgi:hypothetical protein